MDAKSQELIAAENTIDPHKTYKLQEQRLLKQVQ